MTLLPGSSLNAALRCKVEGREEEMIPFLSLVFSYVILTTLLPPDL